ncbi:MAG: hypothetical protein EBU70_08685 [Actinobacteria bacterium]|nr:hypothetical protein [Actinomycetota bacterium]
MHAALPIAMSLAAAALSQSPAEDERLRDMQRQIDALTQQIASYGRLEERSKHQQERIRELEAEQGERWLDEQRVQEIRAIVKDALNDSATRQSLSDATAVAGHDRNFFVATPDGNFRLNVEGQLQTRFAWNQLPGDAMRRTAGTPSNENEYGFEMQSVRINLFGNAFDPSWTYRMQFAYERDGALSGNPLRFEDVYLQKALGGGFYVRMGQWKNFLNYEEIVSYRTLQFADRSLVNQYFSTLFVQGLLLGWESEQFRAYASYNDGGNNRDIAVVQAGGNETDWAFTGRAEWKPAGAWGQFTDMQGWRGSPFAFMLGAGVNVQRAAGNRGNRGAVGNGQLTPAVLSPATLLTWAADANLRGDGWSLWAAFLGNAVYDVDAAAAAAGVDNALSLGVVVEGGLFVTDSVELIAKYEGLWVNSGLTGFTAAGFVPNALNSQTLGVVSFGVNQYFRKNALKVTLDGGWAFTPVRYTFGLYGQSIAAGDWRASQSGEGAGEFVIRAQAQLLF